MSKSIFARSLFWAALAAIGIFFLRERMILHRPIDPAAVAHIRVMGHAEAAGPIDQNQVVAWFNQGTDPRRSPDNTGHTTPTGGLFIVLNSGEEIRLYPEGTDFLVVQKDDYYYLKQPNLGGLLDKLEAGR
ncbi:MAG: hypothetical protein K0R39_3040 [Symbiobacteriaceae bacterium]|jgi:hypothetical protein|nr:hypothetical protein [Symbiobacteriaceae bacterium]